MAVNTEIDMSSWVGKKIDGKVILSAHRPLGHDILLLTTKEKTYCCDLNGEELEGYEKWIDHYLEPYSSSFYRKDGRGEWFDIEGHRLSSSVLLIDDVLCSLSAKRSLQSLAFKDQSLYVSKYKGLIQVGKIVFDNDLNQLSFFGQRITGIGSTAVRFADGAIAQEVYLGLSKTAFVLEESGQPLVIDDAIVEEYLESVRIGTHDFEVFRGRDKTFTYDGSPDRPIMYDERAAKIDLASYALINDIEVVCHDESTEKIFIDINTFEPFHIDILGHRYIAGLDSKPIIINGEHLYNIKTKDIQCVYNADTNSLYQINNESIQPKSICDVEGFERYFVFANVNGIQKLVAKKTGEVIRFHEEVEVVEIIGKPSDKLLQAKAVDGTSIVVDMRNGIKFATLAVVDGRKVINVVGEPFPIGDLILQNVVIGTLGGSETAVVNLNTSDLSLFTLPTDLKEYAEQEELSAFAGNPVFEMNFDSPISIGKHQFYQGRFRSYMGTKYPILINRDDARPLHIDGNGHRLELAMELLDYSLTTTYRIGEHRILAVSTLTEDLKSETLLFSASILSSWLQFYDTYLPVFSKVLELRNATDWPCLLYELRDKHGDREYIAVENQEPYRILVENRTDVFKPKIIKSKEKVLKTPEQVSTLKRFFAKDPGYLIEVE